MSDDPRTRFIPVVAAALVCLAVVTLAAPAAEADQAPATAESATAQPRRYFTLQWAPPHEVHTIVEACDGGPGSYCPPPWEVIGRTGGLLLEFDRERMKQDWQLDSRGALAVWGYLTRPGGEPLPIEIPGYSKFGEELSVVDMDLSAASNLVTQMLQGAELATRIELWHAEARLDGLKAQQKAFENLAALELETLAETKRALLRIYEQCLRFTLESRDVAEAAAALGKAEAKRAAAPRPDEAGRAAAVAAFFKHVQSQKVSFQTWLDELLGPDTEPYLEIVATLVGKSEGVIRATAAEVKKLLTQIDAGSLDAAGREAAMHRLIEVGSQVRSLSDDLIVRYRNLNQGRIDHLESWPQLAAGRPTAFGFGDIQAMDDIVHGCIEAAEPQPVGPLEGLREDEASRRAGEWVEQLRTLLRDITGTVRYREVSQRARESFESQIRVFLREHDRNLRAAKSVEERLNIERHELAVRKRAASECRHRLKKQRDFLKVVLMVEVLENLINSIPDVTLPLKKLGLEVDDQVAIVVSLLPRESRDKPPPEQFRADFHVSHWGWQAARWREVKGQITFVRPEKGDNFAPRAGVAALWNFHGKATKRKSRLRAVAPGLGIGATFLDFDDDKDNVEVGLGVTVSFFQDLLHLTYGYNLQAETPDGGRTYFGIGVSLTDVVSQAKGE